jgi:nitrate reductase gamma subunit
MRDYLLFAVAPYVSALVFVTACVARFVLLRQRPIREAIPPAGRTGTGGVVWRSALALVALGHLLAFALPDSILVWDRRLVRLLVLEGSGLVIGVVAVVGMIGALVRRLREDDHGAGSPVDVVAGTLLCLGMLSGLGIAVFYRWASSWSGVTLVPYLYSLARLQPSTNLVTHLPILVKLHVASAFAVLAVFPFTNMAGAVVQPVDRLADSILASASRAFRPAWLALRSWTVARVQTASDLVLRDGEKEN